MKKTKDIIWRYDPYLERGKREAEKRWRICQLVRGAIEESIAMGAGFLLGLVVAFLFTALLLLFLP